MKFRCWRLDMSDEAGGTDIDDALDAEDAAQLVCEKWERDGGFAGDPIPDPIEVDVRDEEGMLWHVEVTPQYDVSFWATKARQA